MKRTLALGVIVAAGCFVCVAPLPARSAGQTVEHTIRSGDNLHLIAGYYYGNPREWKRILKSNRKALSRPSVLTPGTVLRIDASHDDGLVGSYDEFIARVSGK